MTTLATTHEVEVTRQLSATREQVFKAWTDPAALKKWFYPAPGMTVPTVEVDARVGGAYRFIIQNPEGEQYIGGGIYEEVTPPSKLVFTWKWDNSPAEPNTTRVTVELFDSNGGTEIRLRHELLSSDVSVERHTHGWNGCLDSLAEYFPA